MDLKSMIDSYRGLTDDRKIMNWLMVELQKLCDEMKGVEKAYDEKYAAVSAEKAEKMKEVNHRYGEKMAELRKIDSKIERGVGKVSEIINILNGRALNKIHRLTRLNVEKASYNDKVYYFDEMLDNDFISLRAVILSNSSFTKRISGQGRFHLFVFGYSENGLAGD